MDTEAEKKGGPRKRFNRGVNEGDDEEHGFPTGDDIEEDTQKNNVSSGEESQTLIKKKKKDDV